MHLHTRRPQLPFCYPWFSANGPSSDPGSVALSSVDPGSGQSSSTVWKVKHAFAPELNSLATKPPEWCLVPFQELCRSPCRATTAWDFSPEYSFEQGR